MKFPMKIWYDAARATAAWLTDDALIPLFAGSVAERIAADDDCHYLQDCADLSEAAIPICRANTLLPSVRAAQGTPQYHKAVKATESLLRENWWRGERVAYAMQHRGNLTADEVAFMAGGGA